MLKITLLKSSFRPIKQYRSGYIRPACPQSHRENLPLMKVNLNGDSVTYYANYGQHIVVYHLAEGRDGICGIRKYIGFHTGLRLQCTFIGVGILSPKGLQPPLSPQRSNAYVAGSRRQQSYSLKQCVVRRYNLN